MAPSTDAHCWGHEASLVGGESYCNSMIEPGTHGIPSDACSDQSVWAEHRIVHCHEGKVQRYCNSGYVLRRTAGDVSRGSQCDEKTEFQPTTQAACQEAARKMNRGFEVVNWGSNGPKCFVDARPNQNGVVNVKARWNGAGTLASNWDGDSLGSLAVCTVAAAWLDDYLKLTVLAATLSETNGDSSACIDGELDTFCSTGPTQTSSPSLVLDLGATHQVSHVKLYNRRDCCQSHLGYYTISYRVASGDGWTQCAGDRAAANALGPLQHACPHQARYVKVELPGAEGRILELAEVEVWGPFSSMCPITRSFCTRSPSLPDNCNCGDCGYPACGDCDCDAYGDTSCCYSSWEGGQPTATPSTSCLDSWAVGLTYIGDIVRDKAKCRDASLELCGTAYRRRSDGTYARCEVSSGQCSTINERSMEGGTLDEGGKLRFTCHQPAPSVPFVVRPSPLELSPRHRPAPPLSRLRRYPLPPPLSPAPTPGDGCPSACTARRSPPNP